jgi:uncharacterized protein
MRKNAPVLVLGLLLLAAASLPLRALEVPRLEGRVNDYARILKPAEKSELESFLASVEQKTTAQLVLLTIPSLEGEPLEEYSMRVAETWKIGQKGQDNGVIMLVALEDRAVRIEVGYGLEPILPDGKCGTIIRQAIIPEFRGGNYFGGIQAGFQTMAQVIQGDTAGFDELQKQDKSRGKSSGSFCFVFIIAIFILFSILKSISPCRRFRTYTGHGGGWTSGGGSGGFFSGGGGGFSGGGGGFSGGGGSFGGGGASGHW